MMIYSYICTKCFAKKEEKLYQYMCVLVWGGKRSKKYVCVCILKLKKYGTGSVRFSYDVQKSHKISRTRRDVAVSLIKIKVATLHTKIKVATRLATFRAAEAG